MRSLARTLTAAATAAKRPRAKSSFEESGVLRFTLRRMYKRLQASLVVAAVRCVPNSILVQECWPLLLGFASAPDTLSIPALQFTLAINVRRLPNRPPFGLKDRFALTILVHVPKLRFSREYSDVLALPKN